MRIILHIGLEHVGAERLQTVLADNRDRLRDMGVLFPRFFGPTNHTRLFVACTDAHHIDLDRYTLGFESIAQQAQLRDTLRQELQTVLNRAQPHTLILSAVQLGTRMHRVSELERLHRFLSTFSSDIRIVAHADAPDRLLARHYAHQVLEGRSAPLSRDLDLVAAEDWTAACLTTMPPIAPRFGQFESTQSAPFWMDFQALVDRWETVFGQGSVTLRSYDEAQFYGPDVTKEVCATFDIDGDLGPVDAVAPPTQPSNQGLERARQLNELLLHLLAHKEKVLPRKLWASLIRDVLVDGDAIDPASLSAISDRFANSNAALTKANPDLSADSFEPLSPQPAWVLPDPGNGFRASQYLLAFMRRIDDATRDSHKATQRELAAAKARKAEADKPDPEEKPAEQTDTQQATPSDASAPVSSQSGTDLSETPSDVPAAASAKTALPTGPDATAAPVAPKYTPPKPTLSPKAKALFSPDALQRFEDLVASPHVPHNKLGEFDDETIAADYTPRPARTLPSGRSGNVLIACLKNEAPFIVEWVAYHRAIGIDTFLIYTNDCSDGTLDILTRLQDMGVLHHRNNDNWQGKSPQNHALYLALSEPVVKTADWITHIDIDEFINVRCGNGTLEDFFARVPDATNIAMTWRLFGHNGVTRFEDRFVIDQFDLCAPKYCPKPHTVWGYKTLFRNIGAYEKFRCHRPGQLNEALRDKVSWVNGSGQDMTREAIENGWRSSRRSIGYDLLQLNHYGLRSAESFLVKRQRGRALHVNQTIGMSYWVRMDWSVHRDISIKRNLPRVQAEYDRLMADDRLRLCHENGVNWHKARISQLRSQPEFEDLFQQAITLKLSAAERVAYAKSQDVES